MKKIISFVLCIVMVFSVCSISLTANAGTRYYQVLQVSDSQNRIEITADRIITREFDTSQNYRLTVNDTIRHGIIPLSDLEDMLDEFVAQSDENILPNIRELYINIARPGDVSDICETIFAKLNPRGMTYVSLLGPGFSGKKPKTYLDLSAICNNLMTSCKDSLQRLGITGFSFEKLENRFYTSFPKLNRVEINMDPDLIGFKEGGLDAGWDDDRCGYYITAYKRVKGTIILDENVMRTAFDSYIERINSIIADKSYIAIVPDYFVPTYADLIGWYNDLGSSGVGVAIYYVYGDNSYLVTQVQLVNKTVISGDPTFDKVVDAFDVAMTTEYVNTFAEPENEGVKIAMDVVEDGYIDATDLAYVSYIANFEG